jgi:hypothetical protein
VPLKEKPPTVFEVVDLLPLGFGFSRHKRRGLAYSDILHTVSGVLKKAPDGTLTDFDFSHDVSRSVGPGSCRQTRLSRTVTESWLKFSFPTTPWPIPPRALYCLPDGFRPASLAATTDRVGFLYVADTYAGTISQISQTGTKTIFVSGAGQPNYMTFETAGAPVVCHPKSLRISPTQLRH